MDEIVLALTTAGSEEEAKRIGNTLVGEELAACVNVVPHLVSIYRWKGSVAEEQELLLVMKTRPELISRLEQRVRELHSYELPEFIVIEVAQASEAYARWVVESTKR
jgi:periplasmic divalent cation tolerance protein